jgi:hypothetical protein
MSLYHILQVPGKLDAKLSFAAVRISVEIAKQLCANSKSKQKINNQNKIVIRSISK